MPRSKIIGPQGSVGRKNIIVNGSMTIAQRNVTSTGTNGYHTVDRFRIYNGGVGTNTNTQESTNGVAGVSKYSFKYAATNTASLVAGTDAWIRYVIETKDTQNLNLTDSNQNFTVSFYVKCSNTGQSSIGIASGDFGSAQYVSPFTIAAADTWQRVSVTFPGNSALSGVSGDYGIRLYWDIGAGTNYQTSSTNQWITDGDYAASGNLQITGVSGRYLQITGVQFEVGELTDFEFRSFNEELALCQRYYAQTYGYAEYTKTFNQSYNGMIYFTGTGNYGMSVQNGVFPVEMRTNPTVTTYGNNGTASRIVYWNGSEETHGVINRNTRQVTGMSKNAGTQIEDFYSCGMTFHADFD